MDQQPLTFDQYQEQASKTAIYPNRGGSLVANGVVLHPGLDYVTKGLCGEVGELMEHLKKATRDNKGEISEEKHDLIFKEVGDILWYLSQICNELNIKMTSAAQANLDKLKDRQARGVLGGSGDKR